MRRKPRTGSAGPAAAGFTLIEVIVVIAVLAILAGAMAPLIAAKVDQARRFATEDQLQALSDALRAYERDVDAFPPDTGNPVNDLGELQADTLGLAGWRGPYLTAQWAAGDYAQDAWGGTITYAYTAGAATAVLTSAGPDQVAGNGDDLALTVVKDYASVERRVSDTYERLKLVAGDVYGASPTKAPSSYTIPPGATTSSTCTPTTSPPWFTAPARTGPRAQGGRRATTFTSPWSGAPPAAGAAAEAEAAAWTTCSPWWRVPSPAAAAAPG
jgi:general secretion pathway protein G